MSQQMCSIHGCIPVYASNDDQPYGLCGWCEKFSICYKGDEEHTSSLLYNEGCRDHHYGGYSICIPCGLTAYKKKFPEAKDERCICPVCGFHFGMVKHLQPTR